MSLRHDRLLKTQGPAIAIAITAVFYTLYHLLSVIPIFEAGFSLIAVLPVLLAGLFWGYVRQKTGSLSAVIISHALSDLGIMCVYWFIVR
nr:CPBP family intramembrane glutamic endopeptidase [Planococcus lenghuensis]